MKMSGALKLYPEKITGILALFFVSFFLVLGGGTAVSYENHTVKLICLGVFASAAILSGLRGKNTAGLIPLSAGLMAAAVFFSGMFNTQINKILKTEYLYLWINITVLTFAFTRCSISAQKASAVIVFTAAVSAAAGVLQAVFFTGGIEFIFRDYFGGRVYSFFGNPNNFAVFLVFAAPFIIQEIYSRRHRAFNSALYVLCALLILLSKSAMGAAVFVFVSAAVFIMREKVRKKNLIAGAVAIFAGLILAVFIINGKKDSVEGRVFLWKTAVKMAAEQPVFGTGAGNFRIQSPYFQSKLYKESGKYNGIKPHDEAYAHNDLLQFFSETGIFGAVCFLFFVFACIAAVYRSKNYAALAALCGILACSAAHFPFNIPYLAVLFPAAAVIFGRDIQVLPVNKYLMAAAGAGIIIFNCITAGDIFVRSHIVYKLSRAESAGAADYIKNFSRYIYRDYQASFYAGIAMSRAGMDGEAESFYKNAIKLFPYFEGAFFNLGNVYFREGDFKSAGENYTKLAELNPSNTSALNNLGRTLIELGEYQKAIDLLEKAPALGDEVYINYHIALAYFMLDNNIKAIEKAEKALEAKPDFIPALELIKKIKNGHGGK